MSYHTCAHGTSLRSGCDECASMAGWNNPLTTPRWCSYAMEGGPFDGEYREGWYEGTPVDFYRTTVPVEAEPFTRVYWYTWAGPGHPARLASTHEVPRSGAAAQRMRNALGLDEEATQ